MNYYTFKSIHSKFCKDYGYKFTSSVGKRRALHKEYEMSLESAPVSDCEDTAREFLMNTSLSKIICNSPVSLAPLPKAVPVCVQPEAYYWGCKPRDCIKEEGKTPMRYNDNYASASANVTTVQSDTATQRDYLLSRLAKADYPKQQELANLFNLYVDNTPKTYKDMIDAIKNDKFTIDAKVAKKMEVVLENDDEDGAEWYWGAMHGIIWAGPQPDRDGYNTAEKEKGKQYTAAKDIIMTGDATAGLKALQDFEAWLPTSGSTSVN